MGEMEGVKGRMMGEMDRDLIAGEVGISGYVSTKWGYPGQRHNACENECVSMFFLELKRAAEKWVGGRRRREEGSDAPVLDTVR